MELLSPPFRDFVFNFIFNLLFVWRFCESQTHRLLMKLIKFLIKFRYHLLNLRVILLRLQSLHHCSFNLPLI